MEIDPIVRIMGYTANVLWLASFILIAVLSLTRLGVVFFSLDSTKWTVWMKILLSIGFLYILAIWIIGCVTLNFYLSGPSWTYDMNAPFTDILPQMELYLCFPILLLSFISSILILGSIYKKKRQVLASSSLRIEIGILIQVTVLTVYMATLIIFWHNAEKWFEMSDITLSFLNVSWILFAHLNSFLLITTNRSIRQEFLKMIRRLSNPITLKISSSFSQR